jgi:hypothetical protein
MRETLHLASHNPLRRVHDGKPGQPAWPASPNTLYALVRRELLEVNQRRDRKARIVQEWTITENGKTALQPKPAKPRPDRAIYLAHPTAHGGDYTYNVKFAFDDLETLDPAILDRSWTTTAQFRRTDARDRKQAARHLARQARRP